MSVLFMLIHVVGQLRQIFDALAFQNQGRSSIGHATKHEDEILKWIATWGGQRGEVYSRGVRLEAVGNGAEDQAAAETIEEGVLPALLLVLLAGLDAEQPAGRRVVLGAVRGGGPGRRGEGAGDLRSWGASGGLQGTSGPRSGAWAEARHSCGWMCEV
jgi:hypothetical protein